MNNIVIGLFGGGVVAGGVVEILDKHYPEITIKKMCVKNVEKIRDFEHNIEVISDKNLIFNDPEINMYVELIGGTHDAYTIAKMAIEKNIPFVTANKALLSKHLSEFQSYKNIHYEAAVCGGIPIINTLLNTYSFDSISSIGGIMNGTTNYILSRMKEERKDYMSILKDAQSLGYAESDPTADIEGYDARSKLIIMTRLAFGICVHEENIFTQGISNIKLVDFDYAKYMNCNIKLLGISYLYKNLELQLYVSPVLIKETNPISSINGVTNTVEVQSENLNTCYYTGPGAGRYPTANSVVTNIVSPSTEGFTRNRKIHSNSNFIAEFYIRFVIKDSVGILSKITSECASLNISIDSVLQLPDERQNKNNVVFAIITDKTTIQKVKILCQHIEKMEFIKEKILYLPIYNLDN